MEADVPVEEEINTRGPSHPVPVIFSGNGKWPKSEFEKSGSFGKKVGANLCSMFVVNASKIVDKASTFLSGTCNIKLNLNSNTINTHTHSLAYIIQRFFNRWQKHFLQFNHASFHLSSFLHSNSHIVLS
jgi:hypothetical protein